jgi:alpha/beta superfamily hydrolase
MTTRTSTIQSGDLRLEGRLHKGGRACAAVVLHLHPQYGGDMDNHVVVACCEALASEGATVLRFNFRGVGASDGSYDGGRGEVEDARAAIVAARRILPDRPLFLVGYSFGAMIAAAAAGDVVAGLVLVSPPLSTGALMPLPVGVPVLLMAGDRDAISPGEALMTMATSDVTARVFPGVDHGWWPGIDELTNALREFTCAHLAAG